MTSKISMPLHRRRHHGFTLMEIIIVVVIMGIMLAVTVPTVVNMSKKNELRAGAREMIALLKYARTEAVFNERTTGVFLDLDKKQYWLDLREPDKKTGEYKPGGPKRQLEQKRVLGKNLWIEEVKTVDNNIIKDKLIAIDFNPDGSASPALFTIVNKSGSKITVEVLKSTGMTEVTPGSIEDKEAAASAAPPPLPGQAAL
jgi:type II secretion system protein H